MARTATSAAALDTAVTGEMTSEEQAQLDQMRQDDAQAVADERQPEGSVEDAEQQPQERRTVDYGAFREERDRRQQVEAERAELARQNQVLLERTNQILQRFSPPPQPENQVPALEQDPVGHIIGMVRGVHDRQEQQQAIIADAQRQQQVAIAIANLQGQAVAAENEFKQTTPDYEQAIEHMRSARDQQLALFGLNPTQRQAQMLQETLEIAARAVQSGRNPAQMAYDMAGAFGYQRQQPNGQQQTSAQERLRQVSAGQQQSRSVGNMRGSGAVPMTAQRLANMNESEFTKFLEKATPEQMREAFGS